MCWATSQRGGKQPGRGMGAPPPVPATIAGALADHTPQVQQGLLRLRALIFDVADQTNGVGQIVESLKWGQPSYATVNPVSGTPLRIGVPKSGGIALYAHCQTTVISQARDVMSGIFTFDGNRAVLLEPGRAGQTRRCVRSSV